MMIQRKARDLARRLLVYEENKGENSEKTGSATMRVYEKLRGNLCVLAGVAGFQALASRALTLATSHVPGLSGVQVAADGKLQGMSDLEPPMKADEDRIGEEGVILISSLLGLLLMFLGDALTMNLIQNVWPGAAFDDGNPGDGRQA